MVHVQYSTVQYRYLYKYKDRKKWRKGRNNNSPSTIYQYRYRYRFERTINAIGAPTTVLLHVVELRRVTVIVLGLGRMYFTITIGLLAYQ